MSTSLSRSLSEEGTPLGPVDERPLSTNGQATSIHFDPRNILVPGLIEALPAAIYTTDANGRITFYNEAAAALWGCRPELGKSEFCGSWKLYWPDGTPLPHDECPMAMALKEMRPVRGMEAIAERPDGTRVPFIPYPTPLFDASGALTGAVNMLVDITDRKQAECRLRESEARYRGIFENARVAVWEEDFSAVADLLDDIRAEGVSDLRQYLHARPGRLVEAIQRVRLVDVNEFTVELFEAKDKTALLGSLADIFLPETEPIFIEELVALWEGRRRFESDTVVRTLKGRTLDVVFTMAFQGERYERTLVSILDISERKRAEEALVKRMREQAALYQFTDKLFRAMSPTDAYDAALDAITEALGCERASILLFDASGVMRFAAWRGLSDAYRQAVEGHSPWSRDTKEPQPICVEDIDSADIAEELKATVKAEGIGALAFIPLMVKGELIGKFMTYYKAPHVFSGAEIDLAVTIARQLGFSVERMRAEDQRLRAEQELSDFFENASVAFHWVGADGTILKANRRELEMLGFDHDEYIGRHIAEFHVSEDVIADILKRLGSGEILTNYEAQLRCKDGSIRDVLISSSVLRDNGRFVHTRCFTTDITARKQAQARQDLLARELQHRTKNLFAVVQAIIARSFAGKRTLEEAATSVRERIHSLAQTHAILADKEWQGADLADVVRTEMGPYVDRVTIEGPTLMLTAQAAQNFALALHELATNAAKYGALSNLTGRVHISWSVLKPNGYRHFVFRWQERGGPHVTPPTGKGFGSAVLEQVMAEYFETPPQIEFAPDGVSYEVMGPLGTITNQA